MICCLIALSLLDFIFCLDCITFTQEHLLIMAENSSDNNSNNLEVVSMVIWLSTGNGKFFELVIKSLSLVEKQFFWLFFFSMAHVIQSNKFYPNLLRVRFVGVITILQLILIVNLTLSFSKLSSKLAFISKVHQVLVLKVYFVRNTFLSNVIPKVKNSAQENCV